MLYFLWPENQDPGLCQHFVPIQSFQNRQTLEQFFEPLYFLQFCVIYFNYRCCHIAITPTKMLLTSHLLPMSPGSTSTIQTAQMTCPDVLFGPMVIYLIFVLFNFATDLAMSPLHQERCYLPPTCFPHHPASPPPFKQPKQCARHVIWVLGIFFLISF